MPVEPSSLPWWAWLLCGAGGIVVALIAGFYASTAEVTGDKHTSFWEVWFVGMLAGLAGLIALAIGLIRFVKWAWS